MALLRRLWPAGAAGDEAEELSSAAARQHMIPILAPSVLLVRHRQTIVQMRQQVGIPKAHWEALYDSLLNNFAAFVQQLPASEAHHHREAGGLLQHALDTTLKALTIRRGVLMPTGTTPEQLADKQDVWTYATATAALLHDLGKPVVDQVVRLHDADGDLGPWNPLAGPMPKGIGGYTFSYVRGRRYRLHARIPPLLVQYIVPPIGLAWMAKDMDVFEAWLATISGGDSEFSGDLGQIIRQADGLSVAADIAGGNAPVQASGATARPFGERLTIALRQLIDSQALPLNRPGAAGWIINDDLWLVSKRALDALRDQLAQDSAGATAPRNERLMDELQQNGVVMANGDRAIWRATIELGDWRQSFTLLRVPLARLWIDLASRPPAIPGRVVPDQESAAATNEPTAAAPTIGQSPVDPSTAPDRQANLELPADAILPMPPLSATDPASPVPASATVVPPTPSSVDTTEAAEPAMPTGTSPVHNSDFAAWICDSVAAGRLKINAVDARIHVTQEGLLLVSPGIFRDFAGVEGWAAAQKKLQKLKIHLKTPEGTNIWTYRVSGERKSSAQLKGILIPDGAAHFGLKLPGPNPHLSLVRPEHGGDTDNSPAEGTA